MPYSPRVGWVEAVVKIVTGLAWPSVVIVSVLVLRREIGRLLSRVQRVTAPGVEAEFADRAAATNELSAEVVPNAPDEMTLPAVGEPEQGLAPPESLTLQDLVREAETHPVGAVVRAWNVVEHVVERILPSKPKRISHNIVYITRDLALKGLVSDDLVSLADHLQRLRSQVVHGRTIPTADSARDFVEAAWRLAVALRENLSTLLLPPDKSSSP